MQSSKHNRGGTGLTKNKKLRIDFANFFALLLTFTGVNCVWREASVRVFELISKRFPKTKSFKRNTTFNGSSCPLKNALCRCAGCAALNGSSPHTKSTWKRYFYVFSSKNMKIVRSERESRIVQGWFRLVENRNVTVPSRYLCESCKIVYILWLHTWARSRSRKWKYEFFFLSSLSSRSDPIKISATFTESLLRCMNMTIKFLHEKLTLPRLSFFLCV